MREELTSIREVLDRLYRNPLCSDITLELAVDYLLDLYRMVGMPAIYNEKLFCGDIDDYRCKLPCDFVEEIQVLLKDRWGNKYVAARSMTDTFRTPGAVEACDNHTESMPRDYTFSINSTYIVTSIKKGIVKMAYRAIVVDEQGLPMIPSDRIFQATLETFIKMNYYQVLWENGRIPDKVFEVSRQEYAWNVGKLTSTTRMPSLSEMESLRHVMTSLLPIDNQFGRRFKDLGGPPSNDYPA
jgi:hypothetical protein